MDVIANHWHLIVGGGFVIGFLIGITGVGAGSLTTPLLISGVGIPPAVAVGTDLLFASITKASAAWRHHRLNNVDWRILGWLALGSLPGALVMLVWLFLWKPDTAALAANIRQILAVTLVISAAAILLYPLLMSRHPSGLRTESATPARRLPTFLFGIVLGGLVTLTSVGAGAIGVAVLTGLYPTLLARRVVGTDIVHAIPMTLLSGLGHAGMGHVDLGLLAALLVGSVPGILIGSRITGIIPDWLLRIGLSSVLLYAAYMLGLNS
jgi:uncharacterized protein